MPDGREEIKGETITFVDVSRHHSGRYECIADNGYGKVSTPFILHDVHSCHILMFWYLNNYLITINYLILFTPKPAKQVISLDVEYAPEVEATEIFVHAATGNIHTQLYISLMFDDESKG